MSFSLLCVEGGFLVSASWTGGDAPAVDHTGITVEATAEDCANVTFQRPWSDDDVHVSCNGQVRPSVWDGDRVTWNITVGERCLVTPASSI